jgi:hypothetical protein
MSLSMPHVLAALVLVAIAACSGDDDGPAAQPASEAASANTSTYSDDSRAKHDEILKILEPSTEEARRLEAVFQARERVLTGWLKANGDKLTELEQQLAAAARERDLAEVQRIKSLAQPLRDEFRNLIETHDRAVVDALDPQQRIKWAGHLLACRLLELMTSLNLSAEQTSAIRAEAVRVAQAAGGEPNPQAAGFLQLERLAESRVLTPDQARAYEVIKKWNRLRSLQGD